MENRLMKGIVLCPAWLHFPGSDGEANKTLCGYCFIASWTMKEDGKCLAQAHLRSDERVFRWNGLINSWCVGRRLESKIKMPVGHCQILKLFLTPFRIHGTWKARSGRIINSVRCLIFDSSRRGNPRNRWTSCSRVGTTKICESCPWAWSREITRHMLPWVAIRGAGKCR